MVEGGSDQAHRPGHVPENLIPKKLDGTDGAASQLAPSRRLVCGGYGARWRSPARRVLVVLEGAFAESRPSTFSVDGVRVRGVDICSPFSLSDPFGYPAGNLETGSCYPQYRPVSAKCPLETSVIYNLDADRCSIGAANNRQFARGRCMICGRDQLRRYAACREGQPGVLGFRCADGRMCVHHAIGVVAAM